MTKLKCFILSNAGKKYGGKKGLTLTAGEGAVTRAPGVLFEKKKCTDPRAQQCQSLASVLEKRSHACPKRRPRRFASFTTV